MDFINSLNDKQREAVEYLGGPLLILAGAGSGKTRVMTHRIAYLVKEKGVAPWRILAVTFTNKAAREMRERVAALVGEGAKDIWVTTFHSACVRILRKHIKKLGFKSSFVIYDSDDQLTLVKDCLKELNMDTKYYPPREIRAAIGRIKDNMEGPQDYIEANQGDYRKEKIGEIYALYQSKLTGNNALDFNDILLKTLELFVMRKDVLDEYRNRFIHVMVDEYQDTNEPQFQLVRLISGKHNNICVVGDDDQSIYGWRGANIQNILDFENAFDDAKVIKLEENYRSYSTILKAANAVIENNPGRKGKTLWTQRGDGTRIQIKKAENEHHEADFICRTIKKLQSEGKKFGDIGILYRMNSQSRVIEENLMKYTISYQIYGGTRFYDRKEIKDIIAYLRLIINPEDDISLKRVINMPRRGIGKKTIAEVESFAGQLSISMLPVLADIEEMGIVSAARAKKLKEFYELINDLRHNNEVMNLSEFVEYALDKTGYIKALESGDSVENRTRLENVRELVGAAADFASDNPDGELSDYLENIALVSDIDAMDDETGTVSLMTIHSAKGLEFPVVFITGLEEGIFPHSRSLDDPVQMEEERRLCYVAITRAEDILYLTMAENRRLAAYSTMQMKSRFIDELPEELVEEVENIPKPMNKPKTYSKKQRYDFFTGSVANTMNGSASGRKHTDANQNNVMAGKYKVGDRVSHKRFGNGMIVQVSGEGDKQMLRIAFSEGGIKTFMADMAPLKII